MKKCGIITIIDNNNFGNRLQNYAVQQVIRKLGFNSVTLLNDSFSNTKKMYLLRKLKFMGYKGTYSTNIKRKQNFEKFNENIVFSSKKINVFSSMKDYDYLISGSDQVWNASFGRLREVDLLDIRNARNKIALSASFGVSTLDEKCKTIVSKNLKNFKAISVREEAGKKIIDDLNCNKRVEVLIDPTMFLTDKEWHEVELKPRQFDDIKQSKYILNYFLGNLSEERKKEIERIANDNNCEIINLLDKSSLFYECGPSEFLWLEKNAFLICTDSFHSSVFAILYNTPFIVFEREDQSVNMNSRLETLLSKFKLEDRKYNGKITDELLKHNYTEAYRILEIERKKSKDFLEKALDIKKE